MNWPAGRYDHCPAAQLPETAKNCTKIKGSGFKKITGTYRAAHNYRDELEPKFYSDASSFQVTLYNLNYGTAATASKVTIEDENVAIEVAIDRLNASPGFYEQTVKSAEKSKKSQRNATKTRKKREEI